MAQIPKTELTPAEKICIEEWVRTQNASHSFQLAFPNKYPDHKDANRRMKQLLDRPLANEYLKTIKEEIEQKANISKDWLLDEIIKLKEKSEQNMDYSSSVKCLFLIAKMMGYMSKQVIDVKKSVQISFGDGGFNPNDASMIDSDLLLENQYMPQNKIETVNYTELPKIEVEDDDVNRDNAKLDDY